MLADGVGLAGKAALAGSEEHLPGHPVVGREAQEGLAPGAQLGLGVRLRAHGFGDDPGQMGRGALEASPEEAVLAPEQLVHHGLGHAGATAELIHGGAGVAAFREQLLGQLEQLALAHRPGNTSVLEVRDLEGALRHGYRR